MCILARATIIKLLEQSTCINLCDPGLGKDFLEMTLKLHGIKDKNTYIEFHQNFKKFVLQRIVSRKRKDNPQNRRK